jgi:hypothetical protein
LEHVVGVGHILKRFAHFDVYWYFPHEREVQKYLNISTNNKGVGKKFIVFYAWKLFEEVQRSIGMEADNFYAHEKALQKVYSVLLYSQGHTCNDLDDRVSYYEEHRNCILNCNSIDDTTTLY